MKRANIFYFLFALAATLIMLLPVGIANSIFGYILGDSPCILCWGQRLNMIFIALMALFIVRYGFKFKYIGMLLLMAAMGLYESFRHLGSHAGEDIGQGFGLAIFGLHTQFWAEVIFWAVVVVIAILLFFPRIKDLIDTADTNIVRKITKMGFIAFLIFFIFGISNAIQALVSVGYPPYLASGSPTRYSWNPKHWYWTTENWDGWWQNPSFINVKRSTEAPDFPSKATTGFTFDHDVNNAPIDVVNKLSIKSKKDIDLKFEAGLKSFNLYNGKYYVISENGTIYTLNTDLNKIEDEATMDMLFDSTIGKVAGIDFLNNSNKFILMGSNKVFTNITIAKNDDAKSTWANFTKGGENFIVGDRTRLKTIRSPFNYILSYTNDDKYSYMFTVPSKYNKKLVLIKHLLAMEKNIN